MHVEAHCRMMVVGWNCERVSNMPRCITFLTWHGIAYAKHTYPHILLLHCRSRDHETCEKVFLKIVVL